MSEKEQSEIENETINTNLEENNTLKLKLYLQWMNLKTK